MNKSFIQMPAPKRTHRLSIVAVWNPTDPPELKCEHAGCKQNDYEEIGECPVCGRWMCDECAKWNTARTFIALDRPTNDGMLTDACCLDCSKLTNDERRAILEMRAKLTQS